MHHDSSLPAKIYLKPGELVTTEETLLVTTVLGSCISVTMFHRESQVAAICHGMLPSSEKEDSFKYVETSMRYMMKYFDWWKIPRAEIQVKLFGGAEMFSTTQPGVRNLTVGWQNISAARRCLLEYGLVLIASDVGGRMGRKLIFKTDTGIVYIKKLSDRDRLP